MNENIMWFIVVLVSLLGSILLFTIVTIIARIDFRWHYKKRGVSTNDILFMDAEDFYEKYGAWGE